MKTNKEVLKIAQKHIGQGGAVFRKFCGLGSGSAWCNAFVDYVAYEGGVSLLYFNGKKETYCPHSIKWCKDNLAQIPLYLAQPMDIIYFDWEKNGVPNHIGFVKVHKNTSSIYTIEGNTNGGKVAEKLRNGKYVQAVYRPHYKPAKITLGVIETDGSFGYNSIANLQRALGGLTVDGVLGKKTVKRLQHYLAIKEDGNWGTKTSKAVQKLCGFKGKDVDGAFGEKSVRALQRWINKKNGKPVEPETPETPEVPKPQTNADKIVAKINEYAYRYGTPKKDYDYKKGNPKATYRLALKKYLKKTARISQSDCGYFVSTVIRGAGISKTFLALKGRGEAFPSIPKTLKYVHKGKKIPNGLLKAGDIIRYKKKGGGQHTLFYYGSGKIAEAGRGHYFPAIKKDTKKYNKSNVRKSTIQVIRAKE